MGNTEKTGGIGKSPAIEKVNRVENKMMKQSELMKTLAFGKSKIPEKMETMMQIVEDYHISFKRNGDVRNE